MEIEPLKLTALTCFCCETEAAKHKCKIQIAVEDAFITVCLCDDCVKLDTTELRMKFMGTHNKK